MERLDKLLASTGRWSRREVRLLVKEGRVLVDGAPVEMTPKEYDLFFYLVKNRNIALSREKLLSAWFT